MEAAKRERTTAKRLLTQAENRVEKAIREQLSVNMVESRFKEADRRMAEVLDKHEMYMAAAYPDSEMPLGAQETEDTWLDEVTTCFEDLEAKLEAHIKSCMATTEHEAVQESASFDKLKRAYKYEEILLGAAMDSLTIMIEDEEAACYTIKEAEAEMKSLLASYRSAQREFAVNSTEEDMNSELKTMQAIMTRCTKLSLAAGKLVERKTQQKAESSMKKESTSSLLKIERMKMPNFSGNIREYPRFKDDFESQVMPELKSDESAAYVLRQCLNGDALIVVRNADKNVKEMWKRLDDRFGRASKLADVIMNDIRQLRLTNDGDERGFIKLVNTVESSYTDLSRIKKEKEISNSTIVSMIEEKLPKAIKSLWCLQVCEEEETEEVADTDDQEDIFPKFLKFLLKHKRAMEYGASEIRAGPQHRQGATHYSLASARAKGDREMCWLHEELGDGAGSHPIWRCRKFISMTANERVALVDAYKACHACLKKGCPGSASSDKCSFRFVCKEAGCSEKHNHLLHGATAAVTTGVTNHTTDSLDTVGTALLPLQEA